MSREDRTRNLKLLDRENIVQDVQRDSVHEDRAAGSSISDNTEALIELFGGVEKQSKVQGQKDSDSVVKEADEVAIERAIEPNKTNVSIPDEKVSVKQVGGYEFKEVEFRSAAMQNSGGTKELVQQGDKKKKAEVNIYEKGEEAPTNYPEIQADQRMQYVSRTQDHPVMPSRNVEQVPSPQRSLPVQSYQVEQLSPYQQYEPVQAQQQFSQVTGQQSYQYQQARQAPLNPQNINRATEQTCQKASPYQRIEHESHQEHLYQQPQQELYNQQQKQSGGYFYRSLNKPEVAYKSFKKQIVAVHSPKGGVGKTTVSKELAFGLGSVKVNNELLKILVVDADWEFGDVATQFNVSPAPNVSEWIRLMRYDREQTGMIPMYQKEEIADRFIIHYNENIDILAGSVNAADAMLIDADIVSAIMDNLRRCDYDFIIVDNANSLKDITIVPLVKADTIVLIETLDTTTIQETTTMLETLRSIQFDFSKLRMVLNQVPTDDKKLDIGVAEIPRVLKIELTAVIPYYDKIRLYNNAGESAIIDKETPFSREIKKIVNTIMPVYDTKKKGFFSRLFNRKKK